MLDELQLAITNKIDKGIEAKKIKAWSEFAIELYRTEIGLQLQAQQISNELIAPTSAEVIKQSEIALANVKKKLSELQQRRILTTKKFDPVIERLMQPEKQLAADIAANQAEIIKTKQAEQAAEKIKDAKAIEIRQVAEAVRIYIADMHAAYLADQSKLLTTAYEYALNESISIERLSEFKTKLCARVHSNNRTMPAPTLTPKWCTADEISVEVHANFNPWPAKKYIEGFAADVDAKFSDWEQALNDKAAAIMLNQQEQCINTKAITEQKEQEILYAKLEGKSVPLDKQSNIKPLKEFFTIAEPETLDEMFSIINAFAVNRALVYKHLNKIKYGNVGIKQMIAA